jgi:hypothetical protein
MPGLLLMGHHIIFRRMGERMRIGVVRGCSFSQATFDSTDLQTGSKPATMGANERNPGPASASETSDLGAGLRDQRCFRQRPPCTPPWQLAALPRTLCSILHVAAASSIPILYLYMLVNATLSPSDSIVVGEIN